MLFRHSFVLVLFSSLGEGRNCIVKLEVISKRDLGELRCAHGGLFYKAAFIREHRCVLWIAFQRLFPLIIGDLYSAVHVRGWDIASTRHRYVALGFGVVRCTCRGVEDSERTFGDPSTTGRVEKVVPNVNVIRRTNFVVVGPVGSHGGREIRTLFARWLVNVDGTFYQQGAPGDDYARRNPAGHRRRKYQRPFPKCIDGRRPSAFVIGLRRVVGVTACVFYQDRKDVGVGRFHRFQGEEGKAKGGHLLSFSHGNRIVFSEFRLIILLL